MQIEVSCSQCGKQFKIAIEYAGRQGKCGSCGNVILIPGRPKPPAKNSPPTKSAPPSDTSPPATDRQIEYARSLGIDLPTSVTCRQISKLIDDAIDARNSIREDEIEELKNRESAAYQQVRNEVIEELREDGLLAPEDPVRFAIEWLEQRSQAAVILIFDEGAELPAEAAFTIRRSDCLTPEDLRVVLVSAGFLANQIPD